MIEPPKIFAVVSRHDYPRLRRLIPSLPADFCRWIERRYHQRQDYEAASARYAELETVCPLAFGRDCRNKRFLTEAELDDWAAQHHHAVPASPATPRRHAVG